MREPHVSGGAGSTCGRGGPAGQSAVWSRTTTVADHALTTPPAPWRTRACCPATRSAGRSSVAPTGSGKPTVVATTIAPSGSTSTDACATKPRTVTAVAH